MTLLPIQKNNIQRPFAKFGRLIYNARSRAGIAQLVERNLAKVEVAGSNPVSRSSPFAASALSPLSKPMKSAQKMYGWVTEWLCSGLQSRVRRFDSDPSLHHPLQLRSL